MSKNIFLLVIAFNVLAGRYAIPVENDTKPNAKSDTQSSVKSAAADSRKEKGKFAASLNEQDFARTHNTQWGRIFPFNQYQQGGRILPQINFPHPFHNKLPISFSHLFNKPSLIPSFHPPAPAPVPVPAAVAPVVHPFPVKPAAPIYPSIIPQPAFTKPHVPIVTKPTLVVSQQVIHKPIVTENIEVIRRPVLTEVVQFVHKPIVHEELQVIKIPTYSEHVVKKPLVTSPIKNEIQGSPIHLPPQHYSIRNKPQIVPPVTTQVLQIPHQNTGNQGSVGYGSSYGIESLYKPGYVVGSDLVGGASTSYGIPSHNIGSSYGGISTSYGIPSNIIGSTYGGVYDFGGVSSSYPSSSSIGAANVGFGSNYGVSSGYGGESEGVEHTYVEPVFGCKSGDCRPTTNEDLIYENAQPLYSPAMWYNMPSLYELQQQQLYGRNTMGDYEPDGMYLWAMPDSSIDTQSMKFREFLEDPTIRIQLQSMFQDFQENSVMPDEKLVGEKTKGKSSSEDNGMDASDEKMEEEKVKMIINNLKTAKPSTLKKVEENLKELQGAVASNMDSRMGDDHVKPTDLTSTSVAQP